MTRFKKIVDWVKKNYNSEVFAFILVFLLLILSSFVYVFCLKCLGPKHSFTLFSASFSILLFFIFCSFFI